MRPYEDSQEHFQESSDLTVPYKVRIYIWGDNQIPLLYHQSTSTIQPLLKPSQFPGQSIMSIPNPMHHHFLYGPLSFMYASSHLLKPSTNTHHLHTKPPPSPNPPYTFTRGGTHIRPSSPACTSGLSRVYRSSGSVALLLERCVEPIASVPFFAAGLWRRCMSDRKGRPGRYGLDESVRCGFLGHMGGSWFRGGGCGMVILC